MSRIAVLVGRSVAVLMEIPDGLMDPSATAQNMRTFFGFLGPSRRGGYCHFGRSNSRKMQAKTGPVVPFVIRECRYCAGRASGRADVESVAAPVKILSPTRKWLFRPVGRGDRASIILRKCSRHGDRRRGCKRQRRAASVLRFKRAVFPTTTGAAMIWPPIFWGTTLRA